MYRFGETINLSRGGDIEAIERLHKIKQIMED
jgi:hypothetical protein